MYYSWKGRCHEIFYPGSFYQTTSPGPICNTYKESFVCCEIVVDYYINSQLPDEFTTGKSLVIYTVHLNYKKKIPTGEYMYVHRGVD